MHTIDPVSLAKLVMLAATVAISAGYIRAEYGLSRAIIAKRRQRTFWLLCYAGVYASSIIALLLAPFMAATPLRLALVTMFVASGSAIAVYRSITGGYIGRSFLDADLPELLWRERHLTRKALWTYRKFVLPVLVASLLAAAVFAWPPQPPFSVSTGTALILLAGFAGMACFGKNVPFPIVCLMLFQSIGHLARRDVATIKPLQAVNIRRSRTPPNKVILVMDESVRGDYLSLAEPRLQTTPYLASLGDRIIDMGVALSGHNASTYSRYMFRYGARPEGLCEALADGLNMPGPTIWQYASAAGLKTVYVDGFSRDGIELYSGMTLQEVGLIDERMTIPNVAPHLRDLHVADCLLAALRDPAPAFIFVDKYGVHAPYSERYPAEQAHFAPESRARRDVYIAEYRNALRWSVDGFFRTVVPHIDLGNTVLFYTSDHGQSLMDAGYERTHGSNCSRIATGEALVPLFAMTGCEPLRAELLSSASRFKNRASHFDLFPTLLGTLGFDMAQVAARYGKGLFGMPSAERRFLVGFKHTVRWVDVEEPERAAAGSSRPAAQLIPCTA